MYLKKIRGAYHVDDYAVIGDALGTTQELARVWFVGDDDITAANAKKFAAVDDLLEACEAALSHLKKVTLVGDEEMGEHMSDAEFVLETALAKAKEAP